MMRTRGRKPQNVTPTTCPSCCHYVFNAPAWLNVLEVLSPGRGSNLKASAMSVEQIGTALKVSRQRAYQLVNSASLNDTLSRPFPGHKIYTKSRWGHMLLSWWKAAGWKYGERVSRLKERRSRTIWKIAARAVSERTHAEKKPQEAI